MSTGFRTPETWGVWVDDEREGFWRTTGTTETEARRQADSMNEYAKENRTGWCYEARPCEPPPKEQDLAICNQCQALNVRRSECACGNWVGESSLSPKQAFDERDAARAEVERYRAALDKCGEVEAALLAEVEKLRAELVKARRFAEEVYMTPVREGQPRPADWQSIMIKARVIVNADQRPSESPDRCRCGDIATQWDYDQLEYFCDRHVEQADFTVPLSALPRSKA